MKNQMTTPAPWTMTHKRIIERTIQVREHFAIAPAAGPTFALLPSGRQGREDIQEANARLIAAAPDLLAALKLCATAINEEVVSAGDDDHPTIRAHAQAAAQAWAAIEKAEGGRR